METISGQKAIERNTGSTMEETINPRTRFRNTWKNMPPEDWRRITQNGGGKGANQTNYFEQSNRKKIIMKTETRKGTNKAKNRETERKKNLTKWKISAKKFQNSNCFLKCACFCCQYTSPAKHASLRKHVCKKVLTSVLFGAKRQTFSQPKLYLEKKFTRFYQCYVKVMFFMNHFLVL